MENGKVREEDLIKALKYGGMEKQEMMSLIKDFHSVVAGKAINVGDVFPKGIPWPDGIGFKAYGKESDVITAFLDELAKKYRTINYKVFKYGIPPFDIIFDIEGQLEGHHTQFG